MAESKTHPPGVFEAGAGYLEVGIPNCIQQEKDATGQLYDYLFSNMLT